MLQFPNDMDNKQLSFRPTNWRQQWTACVAQLVKNPKTLLDLQKLVVDSAAVVKATPTTVDFGNCETDSDPEPED
jgi:hypothetical protein